MTGAAARTVRILIVLVAACLLNVTFGASLTVGSARPNLALAALLVVCLFVPAGAGAWLGFVVGLFEASYVSLDIGSFLTTRSLVGWAVGALEERLFRDNALVALATVAAGTFLVEGCFYLFAPQPHLLRWLSRALLETAYNSALAIPLYLLVRRVVRGRDR